MKTDRIFVLLLVVMLPMSGCFGDGVGDAEAAEDSTGTTVINNYYNNTSAETNNQQPTYFSSGGIEYASWYEYGVDPYGGLNESHPLNPNNGGSSATFYEANEYNLSVCNSRGGFHYGNTTTGYTFNGQTTGRQVSVPDPKYRPVCTIELATINTTSGEALIIHQWSKFYLETVCEGVEETSNIDTGSDGIIAGGSALNCTHSLYYDMNYQYSDEMVLWSVMYSIQPTVVV